MRSRNDFFDAVASQLSADKKIDALIIVKLCRFKEINTTYGFDKGDQFLAAVHEKLVSIVRPVDVIKRIGDNEFGLFLPALKNPSHSILAANKVISSFKDAIEVDDLQIIPKLVLGIAIKPEHGLTTNELFHSAALALQTAELNGEDYFLYKVAREDFPSSLLLEHEIKAALNEDEFSLFCQPKINLATRKLYGGESLIRWNSHKFGFVNTQYFIDVLEGSSALMPVTSWVLNVALRQCIEYQKKIQDFSVAVNLSPSLLTNFDIVDVVSNAVSIWAVQPSSLVLEVTEGAMMQNPKRSMEILHEFHHQGFGISIDDFGTGYSSLAYLKNLPADEIKIDKSFVMNMANDDKDASIVKSAIDLAHNLGLKTVAEGIEDEKTMDLLAAMGCDYGQGYFMAKPMSRENMLSWLDDNDWC